MIRKPEGKSGASSAKEGSMGANMSSAHVPTALSSIPPHSCQMKYKEKEHISKS